MPVIVRFFKTFLAGAFVAEEVLTPPNTGMKHFGAFLELAQIMRVPEAYEIKAWKDVGDLSRVRELIRVAAIIFWTFVRATSSGDATFL